MERTELRSVENFKSPTDGDKCYKKLYHESVERCAILQSQLAEFSKLLSKFERIEKLKGLVLSSLSEKEGLLEQQRQELMREKEGWHGRLSQARDRERELVETCADLSRTCDSYQTEHAQSIRTCGHLLAQVAIVTARSRVHQENIETKLSKKSVEVSRLKKTVSKYAHSLQRSQQDYKESLEFSEAERSALAESNSEMDSKLSTLLSGLTHTKQQLEEARSELREKEEQLEKTMKENEAIKEAATSDPGCSGCGQLRRELEDALHMLNDTSSAKYGDLLRENFALTRKLNANADLLAKGMKEYEGLTAYIKEYKMKSKEKVEVLKENARKAEEEVDELDSLVDQVRAVLHKEIETVKLNPALLKLIRDLDGVEAPSSY